MLIVKIGGAEGVALSNIARDIAALVREGDRQMVLVHGGSHEINELSRRLGLTPRFMTSPSGHVSRITDRETMDVILMASAGKLNKSLVEALQRCGVDAVGLSGIDGRLLTGPRKKAVRAVVDGKTVVVKDDYSAKIEKVNADLLALLLSRGYLPVVSSVGLSDEGDSVNLDADRAAAAIAVALKADKIVFLTNTAGLLREPGDDSSLVEFIPKERIEEYASLAQGRMKKKVLAAEEAIAGGVSEAVIADGRRDAPVRDALQGKGTVIR